MTVKVRHFHFGIKGQNIYLLSLAGVTPPWVQLRLACLMNVASQFVSLLILKIFRHKYWIEINTTNILSLPYWSIYLNTLNVGIISLKLKTEIKDLKLNIFLCLIIWQDQLPFIFCCFVNKIHITTILQCLRLKIDG